MLSGDSIPVILGIAAGFGLGTVAIWQKLHEGKVEVVRHAQPVGDDALTLNRLSEIVVIFCCMTLTVVGGMYALWRIDRQEVIVSEIREQLRRHDIMVKDRSGAFERLEANQRDMLKKLTEPEKP